MASGTATAMARAFSKWWDRRKVLHGNRFEADAGWKAGAQWALAEAARRIDGGVTGRDRDAAGDAERERCVAEIEALAQELPQ